ncbi:MAG: hypothetical protein XD87_0032 [candidate division WS6 bacterium 36_33]|uniref:Endolytic murein transglycosylase n=1 Tax=candidate division WS6 bacterium 36_33 TaxID=1641388 RepID=A0A101GZJ8_9BACT|nr:MAG: hypothetical protein XD87_0032 [candidate division WS6 bacterium 36_33]
MRVEKKESRTSGTKLFPFFLILIGIGIALVVTDYKRNLNVPNSSSDEKVRIEITEGESVTNILQNLLKEDLITQKNYYYAKVYLRLKNLGSTLQAGVYNLPKNLTIVELIETLQYGKDEEIWVTIPEGLRKDEIAELVSSELATENFSPEEFLALTNDPTFIQTLELGVETDNLEGFLFPDKYSFPSEVDAEGVIIRLVENFKTKVTREYTYEDIILASIVEREGYNGNDRPIIAGIILKRFEEGWLLQTDATLLYPLKDWNSPITQEVKENNNPYNTYKNIGLPPTPICNPGLQSIEAVWNPVETNYYYYIHDNDGNPHYAETLDEHNENINKYLR